MSETPRRECPPQAWDAKLLALRCLRALYALHLDQSLHVLRQAIEASTASEEEDSTTRGVSHSQAPSPSEPILLELQPIVAPAHA